MIISAKRARKEKARVETERRARRQRFKKTTNLLKAATMKNSMFSNLNKMNGGKRPQKKLSKLQRKNTIAMQKRAKVLEQAAIKHNQKQNIATMMFGVGAKNPTASIARRAASMAQKNHFDDKLGTKSETVLLRMVRNDYGAGTEPYINIMSIIGDVKGGKMSAKDAAVRAEVVLASCSPIVGKERRVGYCKLISAITLGGNDKDDKNNRRVGNDSGPAATKEEKANAENTNPTVPVGTGFLPPSIAPLPPTLPATQPRTGKSE